MAANTGRFSGFCGCDRPGTPLPGFAERNHPNPTALRHVGDRVGAEELRSALYLVNGTRGGGVSQPGIFLSVPDSCGYLSKDGVTASPRFRQNSLLETPDTDREQHALYQRLPSFRTEQVGDRNPGVS